MSLFSVLLYYRFVLSAVLNIFRIACIDDQFCQQHVCRVVLVYQTVGILVRCGIVTTTCKILFCVLQAMASVCLCCLLQQVASQQLEYIRYLDLSRMKYRGICGAEQ